ncbi:AAA family ATPase [Vagococcus vulneris]|uniref:DNA polymerase III subunit delta n=1 Tax=Vagococcus vulneris TaxID=1977869 RepID=A0A429ZXX7_9ENTE|nr:AAA family ATPase [Vagococcus vulneris]RST98754.1 hypothetical protein CBF37_06820 [Vagococcus vulneris]
MTENLTNKIKIAQPQLVAFFLKIAQEHKINHSYIFEGEDNNILYETSLWFAQLVLCQSPLTDGSPCGMCLTCRRIIQQDYPDVLTIIPEGQTIKVEQVRQMKQLLTKSGLESPKRILIIREAEKMTVTSANTLLKFIEEPDGDMFIIFLTNNSQRILPTIQSRCQQIHLKPVKKSLMIQQLIEKNIPQTVAGELAEVCASVISAVELFENEWFNDFRETVQKWFNQIKSRSPLAFITVQQHLVKSAKERSQQQLIFDLLIAHYRLDMEKNNNYKISHVETIELIISAKRKLEANVSFQNVAEQLVWRIMA